jgi:hypothetical protein
MRAHVFRAQKTHHRVARLFERLFAAHAARAHGLARLAVAAAVAGAAAAAAGATFTALAAEPAAGSAAQPHAGAAALLAAAAEGALERRGHELGLFGAPFLLGGVRRARRAANLARLHAAPKAAFVHALLQHGRLLTQRAKDALKGAPPNLERQSDSCRRPSCHRSFVLSSGALGRATRHVRRRRGLVIGWYWTLGRHV